MNILIATLVFCFLNFSAYADFLIESQPNFSDEFKIVADKLPDFKKIIPFLNPSVVNISVQGQEDSKQKKIKNPFFKDNEDRSLGSGFVLTKDGYIATNFHVVENAKTISVKFDGDDENYEAKLIGSDKRTDLALLKIDTKKNLVPMHIGNSENVEVGEWVLAIGNQFQLGQTVTAGIISAKSRKVNILADSPFESFIQTDASINPGSSGGPLINTQGQVIGINTAIMSPGQNVFGGQGFNIGIGFAIPINSAKKILLELKKNGQVVRGLLGVIIQPIDDLLQEAMNLKDKQGALVAEIIPNTPADLAGFKTKDLILSFDGKPIEEYSKLPLYVSDTPINKKVKVEVLRNNSIISLFPIITKLSDEHILNKSNEVEEENPDRLGLIVQEITPNIAKAYKLKNKDGVLVVSIDQSSPLLEVGLSSGDIIVELNNSALKNRTDYQRVLNTLPVNKAILMQVVKRNGTRLFAFKLEAEE